MSNTALSALTPGRSAPVTPILVRCADDLTVCCHSRRQVETETGCGQADPEEARGRDAIVTALFRGTATYIATWLGGPAAGGPAAGPGRGQAVHGVGQDQLALHLGFQGPGLPKPRRAASSDLAAGQAAGTPRFHQA
jgi:hypothetical protein